MIINWLEITLFFYIFIFILILIHYRYLKIQSILLNKVKILIICISQILSLLLWFTFDPFSIPNTDNFGYQFFFKLFLNNFFGITFSFGLDSISLIFICLTIFIFNICFIALKNIRIFMFDLFILLILLNFILLLIFATLDLFSFYISFEGSLIPMFLIIGIWGSRSRRIKAAYYLFLYTMTTALLMLLSILYLIIQVGTTFYPYLINYNFSENEQFFLWVTFFLTFITKIPSFPLHIWLPEAHVEAPTIGSIILASILLKLGIFGRLRYLIPLFPIASNFFLPVIYLISILSIIYASLITLRQIDLKRIIAYSSIAHTNVGLLGVFSYNNYGLDGALYLMVGHGIISSALFFLVGILYDRYHSRILRYYSGLVIVMPICSIFFFLFSLGNIGFPGTSNFIGEILILFGILIENPIITFFLGLGYLLSAIYSFWLFNRIFFGTLNIKYIKSFSDRLFFEYSILIILLSCMVVLGLNSMFILDTLLFDIEYIIIAALQV